MKVVKNNRIDKLLRERKRLMRLAKIEHQQAKDLFKIGSLDFADSLQLANQHYGAAQAITYTLDSIGYKESQKLTARQKRMIIEWAKQKLLALSIIIITIMSIITGFVAIPFCVLLFTGCVLLATKKNWLSYIMEK